MSDYLSNYESIDREMLERCERLRGWEARLQDMQDELRDIASDWNQYANEVPSMRPDQPITHLMEAREQTQIVLEHLREALAEMEKEQESVNLVAKMDAVNTVYGLPPRSGLWSKE